MYAYELSKTEQMVRAASPASKEKIQMGMFVFLYQIPFHLRQIVA